MHCIFKHFVFCFFNKYESVIIWLICSNCNGFFSLPAYHMDDCEFSGWANTYDHDIDYTIPDGRVLRGVVSVHDNGAE